METNKKHHFANAGRTRRVLVIGANEVGRSIAAEMNSRRGLGMLPVGFIDDTPPDSDRQLNNLPIFGNLQTLSQVAVLQQVEQVVIALPSVSGKIIRQIVDVCKRLDLQVRIAAINGEIETKL